MKCGCPLYCRFCGAKRRRDNVGHYCPTHNCQYQFGYKECTLHTKEDSMKEIKCACGCGSTVHPTIYIKKFASERCRKKVQNKEYKKRLKALDKV